MRALRVLGVMTGLLLAAPSSVAADVSTAFQASANVVRRCAISATNLSFGVYPSVAPPTVFGTSTITVTCNIGENYRIGLNSGFNALGGGPTAQRRMARTSAPVEYLDYNLYRDAAHTQYWGDTGTTRVAGVGDGSSQSYTVYGRLPGAQPVSIGAYVDTVTVTLRN